MASKVGLVTDIFPLISLNLWLADSKFSESWKLARPILATDRLSRQLTSSPYYSMGSSNLFNAMKYFFVLYKFFCLGLFLYQSGNCIYKYIYQETVTLSQEEPQEDHEIPNICFAFPGYLYKRCSSIYSIEIYFL